MTKYILFIFLCGAALYLVASPEWAYVWYIFWAGLLLGAIAAYELLAEGLSRGGDPKWDEIIKTFSDKVEAKRRRRKS